MRRTKTILQRNAKQLKGNDMNILKNCALIFCMLISYNAPSKTIDFIEDGYLMPASPEIIALAENAAKLFDFEQAYEVAAPKKAGLQINPWNKFIAAGINPQTKNPFFIINEEWFKTLSPDQQTFLLGRNFLMLKNGVQPLSVKVIPFLFIFLTIGLMLLLYWLLGKTNCIQNKWVRAAIAYAIVFASNLAFLNALQTKAIQYFGAKHDMHIIQMTIEKTQNKEAAIQALSSIDTTIKDDFKNGEQFWAPFASLFENYANELKNSLQK